MEKPQALVTLCIIQEVLTTVLLTVVFVRPRFGSQSSSSFEFWCWVQQLKKFGVTSNQTLPVTHSSPVVKTFAMTRHFPSPTSVSGCCRSSLSPHQPSSTWAMYYTLFAWRRRGGRGKRSSERPDDTRMTMTLSITMELVMVEGKRRNPQFVTNMEKSGYAGHY